MFDGNVFLNEFFIPYGGNKFFVLWKPHVFSYLIFFLQVETVTEMNDLFFGGGKTIPASKKDFLSSGNCFRLFRASFPQVETISENG